MFHKVMWAIGIFIPATIASTLLLITGELGGPLSWALIFALVAYGSIAWFK